MTMAAVVGNSKDVVRMQLAKVEVAPWVTAGGAGSFVDLGYCRNISIHPKQSETVVRPDNNTWPIGAWPSESDLTISFEAMQANLQTFSQSMSELRTRTLVTGATSAVYPIGEVVTVNEWQVKITLPNQSMKPGSDVYTQRAHMFYRCVQIQDSNMKHGRKDEVTYKFTFRAVYDDSITVTTSVDKVGTITDVVTP